MGLFGVLHGAYSYAQLHECWVELHCALHGKESAVVSEPACASHEPTTFTKLIAIYVGFLCASEYYLLTGAKGLVQNPSLSHRPLWVASAMR